MNDETENLPQEVSTEVVYPFSANEKSEREKLLSQHLAWLDTVEHEFPDPRKQLRIAVYIRFYNSTRHPDFLEHTKRHYEYIISQCPNWSLVDFYVDMGASVPRITHSKELMRMLNDCDDGKIDVIVTKRMNKMSKDPMEITLLARYLATKTPPVGIYFESDDVFTTASYYMEDMRDTQFLPEGWKVLSDLVDENGGLLGEQA